MKKVTAVILAILLTAALCAGCQLFEKKPETIALDKTELSMTVGDIMTLSAGDAVKVHWSSGDDSVATVSAGTVSAKAAGTTVITAALENGSSATCNVTVTDKLIESITLTAQNTQLGLGKTIQLGASFAPSDASERTLSWSSEDEEIAVVTEEGFVTGMGVGSTKIVCKSNSGVEAACTVTVSESVEKPTNAPATQKPTEKPTEPTQKNTEKSDKNSEGDGGDDTPAAPAYSGDFLFPDSSLRYLSDSEVKATLDAMTGTPLSGSFSQDAVNEIFARNGYVFRTASLKAYYESKSWYHANPEFNPVNLSVIEQYNIALFSKY